MKITVENIVAAPVNKVWDYWIDPKHIVNWNFASADWCCPKSENNLSIGGEFKNTMAAKDGSMSFDFIGRYTDIQDLTKLCFELEDRRTVTVIFEAINQGTKITEIFDAENENPVEMQQSGWQAILDNFKSYVETN